MAGRSYFLNDPQLSEYVFHAMRMCPLEKKKELSQYELQYFKNEKAMRRFADYESMEKRLVMLNRIGISFALVVAPMDETDAVDEVMQKVTSQYRSGESRKDIVETMAKKKIFVMSSRDTLVLSHMAAQNSHSQVYVLDYRYVALHDRITELFGRPMAKEMDDAAEAVDYLSKIALEAMKGTDVIQSIAGCTDFEMRILMAMYPGRQTMVTRDRVTALMGLSNRETGVSKAMGDMERKGYLLREPGYGKNRHRHQVYMLSDKGIDAALKYLTYLIAKATKP